MRLTLKLVLAFVTVNAVLAAMFGYWAVDREIRVFEENAQAEAQAIGDAMDETLAEVWREAGQDGLLEFLRQASSGRHRVRIRWVWFDAAPASAYSPCPGLTALSIERHVAVVAADRQGTPRLHVYWPVPLDRSRKGGLEFSRAMAELEEKKRDVMRRTAWLVGGMFCLSGLLAAFIGLRYVGAPLEQLGEMTRRVAAGDLSARVHLRSRDELAELGEGLNQMCAQLAQSQSAVEKEAAARMDAVDQLRHADRLRTVGRLAAGIAHELGTPLQVVSGRAGLIASGQLSSDEVGQSAGAIKAETEKMTRIIRQLLDFARPTTPHKASVDLNRVVRDNIELLSPLAEKRNVRLSVAATGDPPALRADAGQLQQVLTNLVMNAIQAMPEGGPATPQGTVEIALDRRRTRPPDSRKAEVDCAVIEVRDEGVGVPAEHLPHIFEPFFTTKEHGQGTGLGLSIAYGIVQEHGGWIEVASRPGRTCFTVFLPAERPA